MRYISTMANISNPGISFSIGQPRMAVNQQFAQWFNDLVKG